MSFFSWLKRIFGFDYEPRHRPLVLTRDEPPVVIRDETRVVLRLSKDRPQDGCGVSVPLRTDYSTGRVVNDADDGIMVAAIADAVVDIASDPFVQEATADFLSGVADAIGDAISSIDIDFN